VPLIGPEGGEGAAIKWRLIDRYIAGIEQND
jgi:hypothetical protein